MAIFVIVSAAYLGGALEFVDRGLTDLKFRAISSEVDPTVVLVAVDSKSLLELEVWPWPDHYHATVLESLASAGANKVAFDVKFANESPVEGNDRLSEVLQAMGSRLVLPASGQRLRGRIQDDGEYSLSVAGPEWSQSATLVASAMQTDGDGRVRRYDMNGEYLNQRLPTLAAALSDRSRGSGHTFYLDYGIDPAAIPTLSYVDVLNGRIDAQQVYGKTVIVGITAVELGSTSEVPIYGTVPDSTVQALAVESLAQGRDLTRLGSIFTLVLALAMCLMLAAAEIDVSRTRGVIVMLTVVAGLILASVALQLFAPLLIDIAPLVLVMVGGYVYDLVSRIEIRHLGSVLPDKQTREDDGSLWLGTWGDGIIKLDKNFNITNQFKTDSTNRNSLNDVLIRNLYKDINGKIWVGTNGLLHILDPITMTIKRVYEPITKTYPQKLFDIINQKINSRKTISKLTEVGNSQDLTSEFSITKPREFLIVSAGEGMPTDSLMADFGWIEDKKGNVIWSAELAKDNYHLGNATKK